MKRIYESKRQFINKSKEMRQRITELEESKTNCQERWQPRQHTKELDFLVNFVDIIIDASNVDHVYRKTVDLIPRACQYPEITCARINVEGKEFKTKNYKESEWKQLSDIKIAGAAIGSVEIGYLENRDQIDKGPSNRTEKLLTTLVAGLLGAVTKRRRIEDELRESKRRLQGLLDGLPDIIIEYDENMTCIWANKVTLDKMPNAIGQKCYKMWHHRDEPCEHCPCVLALATGNKETANLWKTFTVGFDGDTCFEVRAVPRTDEHGKVIGGIEIGRDVTERAITEQRAQMSQHLALIGQLAAGMAHEINNPLTGVLGFLELLGKQEVPEHLREYIDCISEGAQRVSRIVRDLLTFARQGKLERENADINRIIESTLSLQAYALRTSNISVTAELDTRLPKTTANISQLQEVFHNLIINAQSEMKSAHGRGTLKIKTEVLNNTIRISFKDDGPGIDKQNLSRLFSPFFTTRSVGEGTGLGLSISHGIISDHNGRIYAESSRGKGATFIVELPIVNIVNEECDTEMDSRDAKESDKSRQAKILVVDDEPLVRKFLTETLTRGGHEVTTVGGAQNALGRLANEDYDIVFIDIKLPGMSGIQLFDKVKESKKALIDKIVFITGDVIGEETMNFLSRCKVPYLIKPIHTDELQKQVSRVLGEILDV